MICEHKSWVTKTFSSTHHRVRGLQCTAATLWLSTWWFFDQIFHKVGRAKHPLVWNKRWEIKVKRSQVVPWLSFDNIWFTETTHPQSNCQQRLLFVPEIPTMTKPCITILLFRKRNFFHTFLPFFKDLNGFKNLPLGELIFPHVNLFLN